MQRLLALAILAGLSVLGLSLWQWNAKRPRNVDLDQLEKMRSVPDVIVLWGDVTDKNNNRRTEMLAAQRWDNGIIAGYTLAFLSTGLLTWLRCRDFHRWAGAALLLVALATAFCDIEENRRLAYILETDIKTLQGNSADMMLPLTEPPRDFTSWKWIFFFSSSALTLECCIRLLRRR